MAFIPKRKTVIIEHPIDSHKEEIIDVESVVIENKKTESVIDKYLADKSISEKKEEKQDIKDLTIDEVIKRYNEIKEKGGVPEVIEKVSVNQKPSATTDENWKYLREQRNRLLEATDYVNSSANPLSIATRTNLYNYRQQLRDITKQVGAPWTPETIPWPKKPD